jgi:hypothetical protein
VEANSTGDQGSRRAVAPSDDDDDDDDDIYIYIGHVERMEGSRMPKRVITENLH